jgi:hypothetical protein
MKIAETRAESPMEKARVKVLRIVVGPRDMVYQTVVAVLRGAGLAAGEVKAVRAGDGSERDRETNET